MPVLTSKTERKTTMNEATETAVVKGIEIELSSPEQAGRVVDELMRMLVQLRNIVEGATNDLGKAAKILCENEELLENPAILEVAGAVGVTGKILELTVATFEGRLKGALTKAGASPNMLTEEETKEEMTRKAFAAASGDAVGNC